MKKIIFTMLILFVTLAESNSQWTNNTSSNTSICSTTGDQATPKIATTSDGGSYITWFDNRGGSYAVYLQKLNKFGVALFPANGLLISSNPQSSSLQDFNIDVDASDNAVIVFTDQRNGSVLNPFAYLISPTGIFLWGANGISLTDSTTLSQNVPQVVTTSDNNFVFAWHYSSGGNRILAMQKLNSAGVKLWGTGGAPVKLRPQGNERWEYPRFVKSNAGSVIMSWDSYTGTFTTTSTIKLFTQKFDANGNKLWTIPQDTVQALGRLNGISYIPTIVTDGADGAVYTWTDDRDINSRASAWIQHFNSSGVAQFPKNGSEATTQSANQHFNPSTTYLPATGETITFWTETNGGQTLVGGLYGQKFDASGNRQWGSNGKEFKALDNNQLSFISTYSIDTNVVVTYTETIFASVNALVKGMKTGPSSEFHWPGNIITASSSLGGKIRKQAILDKNSGMSVMTWSNGDIPGQNINLDGTLGIITLDATFGIEAMWDGSAQVQDTVRFYLRNNSSPYAIKDSSIAFLNSAGNANVYFSAPGGNFYIQTTHRSALETWSASDLPFTPGSTTSYDFTTAQSQTYGNNSVLNAGRYCSYSGEIIKDGAIDLSDMVIVFNDASAFASGYLATDVNGDGVVDLSDLVVTFNNANNFVVVMKP